MRCLRTWAFVVTFWACALSAGQAQTHSIPAFTWASGGAPNPPLWTYCYRVHLLSSAAPGASLNTLGTSAQNGANRNIPTITQGGPFELIIGYQPGSESGPNQFIPLVSYFSKPSTDSSPRLQAVFPSGLTAPVDWTTVQRTEGSTGYNVDSGGNVSTPPPSTQEVGHKVGFTVTNSGTTPKDYVMRARDASGQPIEGWAEEAVFSLAPGESRSFSMSRPSGPGAGGNGAGAFSVNVSEYVWQDSVEFGLQRNETEIGEHSSSSVTKPTTPAPSPIPQESVSANTTSAAPSTGQPAAANTPVSGAGAPTATQANTMNENTINELKRLGATVKAGADQAHSDAVGIMGKLGEMSGKLGEASTPNMDGVEGKLDDVKASVDGVGQGVEGLGDILGEIKDMLGTDESGETEGDYAGELAAGSATLNSGRDTFMSRVNAFVDMTSGVNILPPSMASTNLDFTINTSWFGSIPFNLSQYATEIGIFRNVVLMVIAWQMFLSALGIVRSAYVDKPGR